MILTHIANVCCSNLHHGFSTHNRCPILGKPQNSIATERRDCFYCALYSGCAKYARHARHVHLNFRLCAMDIWFYSVKHVASISRFKEKSDVLNKISISMYTWLLGSGHYLRQGRGSVEFRKSLALKLCPPSTIANCVFAPPSKPVHSHLAPPSVTIHTYYHSLVNISWKISCENVKSLGSILMLC